MSRRKPRDKARNMLLESITVSMLSITMLPVLIAPWFSGCSIHFGKTRLKNRGKPRTTRFLVELRSTNWRLERPTAVMIPNMTQKIPPMIGSGMVTQRAPILLTTPMQRRMPAAYWMTLLLPTLVTPMAPMFSL